MSLNDKLTLDIFSTGLFLNPKANIGLYNLFKHNKQYTSINLIIKLT